MRLDSDGGTLNLDVEESYVNVRQYAAQTDAFGTRTICGEVEPSSKTYWDCTEAPYIDVTSATNDNAFDEGSNHTLTLTATDDEGTVDEVKILLNGELQATYANGNVSHEFGPISAGNHVVRIEATDDEGKTSYRNIYFTGKCISTCQGHNLLQNPGFEDGKNNWIEHVSGLWETNEVTCSGTGAVEVNHTDYWKNQGVKQYITRQLNAYGAGKYLVSAIMKQDHGEVVKAYAQVYVKREPGKTGSTPDPSFKTDAITLSSDYWTEVAKVVDVSWDKMYYGWFNIESPTMNNTQFYVDDCVLEKLDESSLTFYNITATSGRHGEIWPSGHLKGIGGRNREFIILPDEHYEIEDVIVDGASVGAVTSYTFEGISADHTITVSYTPSGDAATITATAGENGEIYPSGDVQVAIGSDETFEFVPDLGYRVASVLVNGVEQALTSTFTFKNIQENQTISVTFDEVPARSAYQVFSAQESDANSGDFTKSSWCESHLGQVDGGEWIMYSRLDFGDGTDAGIKIRATAGYDRPGSKVQVRTDSENGTLLAEIDIPNTGGWCNYRDFEAALSGISGVKDIYLVFVSSGKDIFDISSVEFTNTSINTFTITTTTGENGTVSPLGGNIVNEGSDFSVTISPDAGYEVADVLVDGVSVGAVSSYSFSSIDQDHSLSASFEAVSGIKNNDTPELSIYPNPASNIFTINLEGHTGTTHITIYSTDGKMVYNKTTTTIKYVLNTSELGSKGIYIIKVQNGQDVQFRKLVVN